MITFVSSSQDHFIKDKSKQLKAESGQMLFESGKRLPKYCQLQCKDFHVSNLFD